MAFLGPEIQSITPNDDDNGSIIYSPSQLVSNVKDRASQALLCQMPFRMGRDAGKTSAILPVSGFSQTDEYQTILLSDRACNGSRLTFPIQQITIGQPLSRGINSMYTMCYSSVESAFVEHAKDTNHLVIKCIHTIKCYKVKQS